MNHNSAKCFELQIIKTVIAMMLIMVSFSSDATAQGRRTADGQKTELGIRQKMVQRQMVELEKKFMLVADRIREEKPQRAELLVKTYQRSKEQSLTRKMDSVTKLLNASQYDEAGQKLDDVVLILDSLIRLLTNEKEKAITPEQEQEMLEKIKKRIQQQLEKQQQQTSETKKASNKDDAVENVSAQINALKGLIKEQSDLVKETGKNSDAKLNQLGKLADRQFDVRRATDELKKNVMGQKNSLNKDGSFKAPLKPVPGLKKRQPKSTGGSSKEKQTDSADDKPSEQNTGGNDSEKGKSSAGKPDSKEPEKSGSDQAGQSEKQNQPNDSKPGDSKPSDGKPSDGKAQQAGPSQSQPSSQAPPQPGQQALQKAQDRQKRAEEKLGSGKPADAKRQQQAALDDLKKALSELEREKRRIESLPPEILEQLAKEQRRQRGKTLDLIKEMKEAPKPKPSGESGGDQPSSESAPGQQAMEQAQQAQDQAAKKMDENDAEGAQQQQQKAENEMKKALEEIEDRLSQLREETNEEKLARLEARFREMLDRQKEASVITIEIEDKRVSFGEIHHRDQLMVMRLATEELEIRETAQQAYDVLLEDGTSIVFPEVVQDIRVDMETAANLLKDNKTDQLTQLVQKEIETGIADLIDALKKSQKKKKGGGGGGGGGGGKQPLLKQSAELKILRMRQRRLNRRTSKLEIMKGNQDIADKVDREIQDAAQMQAKILEMTENIISKQQ